MNQFPTTPRPKIEYLMGRRLESAEIKDGEPVLTFEGGTVVRDKSGSQSISEAAKARGMVLLSIGLGERSTRLFFGSTEFPSVEVMLDPVKYTIADPERPEWGEVRPQMPEELEAMFDTLPPHPDERVAEGPHEGPDESEEAETSPEQAQDSVSTQGE